LDGLSVTLEAQITARAYIDLTYICPLKPRPIMPNPPLPKKRMMIQLIFLMRRASFKNGEKPVLHLRVSLGLKQDLRINS
jgi:hypothetical protein